MASRWTHEQLSDVDGGPFDDIRFDFEAEESLRRVLFTSSVSHETQDSFSAHCSSEHQLDFANFARSQIASESDGFAGSTIGRRQDLDHLIPSILPAPALVQHSYSVPDATLGFSIATDMPRASNMADQTGTEAVAQSMSWSSHRICPSSGAQSTPVAQAISVSSKEENPICPDCRNGKRFKRTEYNEGKKCNKHTKKDQKEQKAAQTPHYVLRSVEHPWITSQQARDMVYPILPPLLLKGDDYVQFLETEPEWVGNFIRAANTVYGEDSEPTNTHVDPESDLAVETARMHADRLRQQTIYNHKPHEESSKAWYTNDWVVTRFRFLFQAVRNYHAGGPHLYPVGGSNNGYGRDTTTRMGDRLKKIAATLAINKRVVMDVIEGRGVCALAANPDVYANRKDSNNKCNTRKKQKLDNAANESSAGDPDAAHQHSEDDYTPTPRAPTRKRRKGKQAQVPPPRTERTGSVPDPYESLSVRGGDGGGDGVAALTVEGGRLHERRMHSARTNRQSTGGSSAVSAYSTQGGPLPQPSMSQGDDPCCQLYAASTVPNLSSRSGGPFTNAAPQCPSMGSGTTMTGYQQGHVAHNVPKSSVEWQDQLPSQAVAHIFPYAGEHDAHKQTSVPLDDAIAEILDEGRTADDPWETTGGSSNAAGQSGLRDIY
ncbi:hypothetical protein BAUCODRAFT_305693 [Baudoinia panamericana UAMH 10762]|uniref:Uncharacterized protein n=1 Tax=Baudoinia panamericana (strain UAMH 10762) TaxID=717646 RepID=M2MZN5_BAUPA|nr:uncharacterized protein BAUCODRAFT_305693 [Baudoinia panamericana UAMH 10762]EMC91800.1 hypothetical protein BAUCODRAFT_305693 [Baudoinia panamericana UAMH 10762]